MDSTIIGALIGVIGIIIGALLTHSMSKIMVSTKKKSEYFKKVHLKILPMAEIWFMAETQFRRSHDLKSDYEGSQFISFFKSTLEENIETIEGDLYQVYIDLKYMDFVEDFSGFMMNLNAIEKLNVVVDELIKENKKLKICKNEIMDRYKKLRNSVNLWIWFSKNIHEVAAINTIMAMKWNFKIPIDEIFTDSYFNMVIKPQTDENKILELFKNRYYKEEKDNLTLAST